MTAHYNLEMGGEIEGIVYCPVSAFPINGEREVEFEDKVMLS